MKNDNIKIAVVVVTYRKLEFLKKCIDRIKFQSRKVDKIFVINNGGEDDTAEWLFNQGDIFSINQQNTGGAGGFRTGIKKAFDMNFDWIWCLDDDCLSDINALDSLSPYLNRSGVLNSLVLSSKDGEKLAFGLYEKKNEKYYQKLSDVSNKEIIESANFFNGSLFHRSILAITGFPSQELFIRGDEYEFYLRILKAGFNVCTVTKSIVYHPPEDKLIINNRLFYHEFLFLDSIKRFYHIRNLFLITRHYDLVSYKYLFKIFILDIILITVLQKKPLIIYSHLRGFLKGLIMNVKFQ